MPEPDSAPPPHRSRRGNHLKGVLLYGVIGGLLIAVLQLVEYRFLVVEHSLEIYGGLIAAIFAGAGIWLGLRLNRVREKVVVERVPATPFVRDEARVADLGLTPREVEILEHIAAGSSNREIAERLFVSENTVKTHAARAFAKLGARRRTDAVRIARQEGVIA